MKPKSLQLFALLCALLFVSCQTKSPENNIIQKPNIVFILADDMGYGDLGCYNKASKIPTPHIDKLAQSGVRFINAHSAGAWCVPSRYGLLTGCYPGRLPKMKTFDDQWIKVRLTVQQGKAEIQINI